MKWLRRRCASSSVPLQPKLPRFPIQRSRASCFSLAPFLLLGYVLTKSAPRMLLSGTLPQGSSGGRQRRWGDGFPSLCHPPRPLLSLSGEREGAVIIPASGSAAVISSAAESRAWLGCRVPGGQQLLGADPSPPAPLTRVSGWSRLRAGTLIRSEKQSSCLLPWDPPERFNVQCPVQAFAVAVMYDTHSSKGAGRG